MRLNLILLIPESTDISSLPDAAQDDINALLPRSPNAVMSGTQVVDGKYLHYAAVTIDAENPLESIEQMIAGYSLDWNVEALQTAYNDDVCEQKVIDKDPETGETTTNTIFVPCPKVYRTITQETLDKYVPSGVLTRYQGTTPWAMPTLEA